MSPQETKDRGPCLNGWHRLGSVSRDTEDLNRRLLRARDAMDRAYAEPLDVRAVAAVAHISEAHFSRCFHDVFGETPHRYLQRRRVERSMFLLRETDRSVTDVCLDVGFTSLGTFSRTFRDIVGETPSAYRQGHGPIVTPHCVQLAAMRPMILKMSPALGISEQSALTPERFSSPPYP